MKFHMNKASDLAGFSKENFSGPGKVRLVVRQMLTSDDPMFYHYIDQISNTFLRPHGVVANKVCSFLVVLRADSSADVYVNDIPMVFDIRAKRSIKQGEVVTDKDIADIGKVSFPEITIQPTDKVFYCFKVGWRFGLFFDCSFRTGLPSGAPANDSHELNIEQMQQDIAVLLRYLSFYHVYKVLKSGVQYEAMLNDGWFPFSELLPGDYKQLSEAYENNFDIIGRTDALVAHFTPDRISRMTAKWWGNSYFSKEKKLIEAGINAYLQNTDDGIIHCIKTITSEIEGILRRRYRADKGTVDKAKAPDLIRHIIERGKKSSGSEFSLLLETPLLDYMVRVVFAHFSEDTGNVSLSRHSAGHGAAPAEQYTRARALQFILTLDQIYYFTS